MDVYKNYIFFHSDQKYFIENNYGNFYIIPSKDPEISSNIFFNNEKRSREILSLTNFKKKCDYLNPKINHFIDVGASIGNILIPAISKNFFEKATAFEPSDQNFKLCSINILINNLSDKINLKKCAVSNKSHEILNLELHPNDVGDHRIRYKSYKGLLNEHLRNLEKVESYSLDKLFMDTNLENSALWLNNQGSEAHTLAGGSNVLKKYHLPIFLEFSPYYINNSDSFDLLIKSFENLNYSKVFDADTLDYLGNPNKDFFKNSFDKLGIRTRSFKNFIII